MKALIRITPWERSSHWRRLLGAFTRVGVLIASLVILLKSLGPPVEILTMTRWEARKFPAVKIAPQALSDYSVSNSPGTTLSYFGYEFEVPWNTGFKQRAIGKDWLAQLQFESGHNLVFIVPPNRSGLLTEIVEDESLKMNNLRFIFGELMNRSPYEQYGALLNTTPGTIRAFGPRAEAIRGATLLTIKAIAVGPGLGTGAFSFELPGKHGFQIGDPLKAKRVDLEIFDSTGSHIEILCFATVEGARFSQRELNRILMSLHSSNGNG